MVVASMLKVRVRRGIRLRFQESEYAFPCLGTPPRRQTDSERERGDRKKDRLSFLSSVEVGKRRRKAERERFPVEIPLIALLLLRERRLRPPNEPTDQLCRKFEIRAYLATGKQYYRNFHLPSGAKQFRAQISKICLFKI